MKKKSRISLLNFIFTAKNYAFLTAVPKYTCLCIHYTRPKHLIISRKWKLFLIIVINFKRNWRETERNEFGTQWNEWLLWFLLFIIIMIFFSLSLCVCAFHSKHNCVLQWNSVTGKPYYNEWILYFLVYTIHISMMCCVNTHTCIIKLAFCTWFSGFS